MRAVRSVAVAAAAIASRVCRYSSATEAPPGCRDESPPLAVSRRCLRPRGHSKLSARRCFFRSSSAVSATFRSPRPASNAFLAPFLVAGDRLAHHLIP